jgi:hypothetical protein
MGGGGGSPANAERGEAWVSNNVNRNGMHNKSEGLYANQHRPDLNTRYMNTCSTQYR